MLLQQDTWKKDLLNAFWVIRHKHGTVLLCNSDLHASGDQLGGYMCISSEMKVVLLLHGLSSFARVKQIFPNIFWMAGRTVLVCFFPNSLNIVFNCIGHSSLFNPRTLKFTVCCLQAFPVLVNQVWGVHISSLVFQDKVYAPPVTDEATNSFP